ncbi:MAG: hypothetical protein HY858_12335 [Candidatus Solibacter usitatus]|nr:hypothetical protein [Candidatus Solibacter usitatus]
MPTFRVHRMKDGARQPFRWAPHTSGVMSLKPRDFAPAGEVEARSFYDAWMSLRGTEGSLDIGDALEAESGELRICKYVGFEEARWVAPEARPADEPAAARS